MNVIHYQEFSADQPNKCVTMTTLCPTKGACAVQQPQPPAHAVTPRYSHEKSIQLINQAAAYTISVYKRERCDTSLGGAGGGGDGASGDVNAAKRLRHQPEVDQLLRRRTDQQRHYIGHYGSDYKGDAMNSTSASSDGPIHDCSMGVGDPVSPPSGGELVSPPSCGDPVSPPSGGDPVSPPSGGDPVSLASGGDKIATSSGTNEEQEQRQRLDEQKRYFNSFQYYMHYHRLQQEHHVRRLHHYHNDELIKANKDMVYITRVCLCVCVIEFINILIT